MSDDRLIAVVTPTTGDFGKLKRCADSIAAQNVVGAKLAHVLVWDGSEMMPCVAKDERMDTHVICLPKRANNAGATPRAVGSTYAVGTLGASMLAFLDDDNEFDPTHLLNGIGFASHGAEVIAAGRVLCHYDTGAPMALDGESDGVNFCDTSCLLLAGKALKFGATWDWPPPNHNRCPESGADRVLWERLKRSFGDAIAKTGVATVRYRTPWLGLLVNGEHRNCHYTKEVDPPQECKVRVFENGRQPYAIKVRPTAWLADEQRWGWEQIREEPAE